MFSKILIANRGEIACRVIRTAKRLGIKTVAVYSDADANALHVKMADEAIHIGGSAPQASYLLGEKILEAAKDTGAQAIHPGYGFLSENAEFSNQCAEAGLTFIGPPAGAIETMGSKSAAKQAMEEAGVPLLPGYHGNDQNPLLLKAAAEEMGYPVLLKAVAGGGGKGMRQVSSPNEFDEALTAAKREALSSFGNDDMLIEKFLTAPRHVEVQVFCDTQGNGVYLFERDCSVQRRHQKIIEEAPAPGMTDDLRIQMGEAALQAAQAVNYVGAGTVEFLLDTDGAFYFMEMNTRLQVEHPVTEMITGQDLVEWQLLVAKGDPLPLQQGELAINGHSFEARIYAEDPDNDFLPAAGKITWLKAPDENPYVRVDTGVSESDQVGVFYDPMIAKLIVWGEDRASALERLAEALDGYQVVGVTTNIDFLKQLAGHAAFRNCDLTTGFIDQHTDTLFKSQEQPLHTLAPYAAIYFRSVIEPSRNHDDKPASPWDTTDYFRLNEEACFKFLLARGEDTLDVSVLIEAENHLLVTAGDHTSRVNGNMAGNRLEISIDNRLREATIVPDGTDHVCFTDTGLHRFEFVQPDLGEDEFHDDGNGFSAPMNGTIVDVLVKKNDNVNAGDTLLIMEAMKMEHAIKAPSSGQVTDIFCAPGELVDGGTTLLAFEPEA